MPKKVLKKSNKALIKESTQKGKKELKMRNISETDLNRALWKLVDTYVGNFDFKNGKLDLKNGNNNKN